VGGIGTSERGKWWGKGVGGWKYSVHIYVNGKMRPIKTIPGVEEGEMKENGGKGDVFDIL
jgi:hypothetical protein